MLEAAEELAQTGECDPQEIYSEARQLEQRMQSFLSRVEMRRNMLDLSCVFYTHAKEVGLYAMFDVAGISESWKILKCLLRMLGFK